MATTYRHLYTSFWKDIYIRKLKEDEKLLFAYLLTNPDTSQCGIYVLDLDLSMIMIKDFTKIFKKFQDDDKIKFNKETNEIAIKNWNTWNKSKSPKVIKHIHTEFCEVSDKTLINYCYSDEQLYEMDSIMNAWYEKIEKRIEFIFQPFYISSDYTPKKIHIEEDVPKQIVSKEENTMKLFL